MPQKTSRSFLGRKYEKVQGMETSTSGKNAGGDEMHSRSRLQYQESMVVGLEGSSGKVELGDIDLLGLLAS